MEAEADSAGIRFPPPFLYLILLLAGLVAGPLLGLPDLGLPPPVRTLLGFAVLLGGFALLLAGSRQFARAGTSAPPWRPATALVTAGIYRRTRNPMYLGMTLIVLAIAILCDSLGALVAVPVLVLVIQTRVIAREERYLEGKFGDAYRQYRQRVRRWL